MRALLWEESHLQPGPATRAASEHALSLLRCLEVANRLSPNLHVLLRCRLRRTAFLAEGPRERDVIAGIVFLVLTWCTLEGVVLLYYERSVVQIICEGGQVRRIESKIVKGIGYGRYHQRQDG